MPVTTQNAAPSPSPSFDRPVLPIPAPALAALDQLRKPHPPAHTSQLIHQVVSAALSKGVALDTAPCTYVLSRLIKGVCTSTSASPHNYSCALGALTRALQKTRPVQPILSQIAKYYSKGGNFDAKYKVAERERVLGILCSVAAVVKAVDAMSTTCAKEAIQLLKQCVSGEAKKWRMEVAVLRVVQRILKIVKRDERGGVIVKNLTEWVGESGWIGVNTVLLLWEEQWLGVEGVNRLVPDLGKGLMEGFGGLSGIKAETYQVPTVWKSALKYVRKRGELDSFWKKVVEEELLNSRSAEKWLLGMELTVLVVEEKGESVLTQQLAKVVASASGGRLGKISEAGAKVVRECGMTFGKRLLDSLGKDSVGTVVKWGVKYGVLKACLPLTELKTFVQQMDEAELKDVLTLVVRVWAEGGSRTEGVKMLFAMMEVGQGIARDVARVMALYCLFDEGGEGACEVEFELLEKIEGYGGVLPKLRVGIDEQSACVGFRRLVDVLTVQKEGVVDAQFVIRFIEGVTKGESCLKLRCGNWGDEVKQVVERMKKGMRKLQKKQGNEPVVRALQVVSSYLLLYLYEPLGEDRGEKHRLELMPFLAQVEDCMHAILGKDDNGPEPIERLAYLIAKLCGREAATSKVIANKAIEVLGGGDDRVVAVLFDVMDEFVRGKGLLDQGADEDGEEEDEDDMDVDNESEDEEDSSNEEESDDGENDDDGDDDENHDGDDEGGKASKVAAQVKIDKDSANESSEGESSDETDIVDMDIDKEDPAVLAEFDKRLGMHLGLLKQQKQVANQRKHAIDFRNTQISRLLDVIQTVARMLRIRLEKSQEEPRLAYVILDLHVRLYEFVLADNGANIRYMKQVAAIVNKHIWQSGKGIDKWEDRGTAVEIVDRFFETLLQCEGKTGAAEDRTIAKSAASLLGVATVVCKEGCERYLEHYSKMVDGILSTQGSFWTSIIVASFVNKRPQAGLKFLPSIEKSLRGDGSKNLRTRGSELLLVLTTAVVQNEVEEKVVKEFWKHVEKLVMKVCEGEVKKRWNVDGYVNMIQVVNHGLKKDWLQNAEKVVECLTAGVNQLSIAQKEKKRLLKGLSKAGGSLNSSKEGADEGGEEEGEDVEAEVEVEEAVKGKKRKRKNRKTK